MSLKDYSTTAASNTSAPPNGAPEGMTLANVNNVIRQVMADVRTLAASDTIASATTCDLGTKDATFLTVSGVTTITGLGTVSAGIYKFVTFSGALTLTHNGTSLILPGAANITTVAGDTALFLSLGSGNWKCMYYENARLATLASITTQQATDLASLSAFMGTVLNDADGATVFSTLGATQSKTSNGYVKLPNGLFVQWGTTISAGSAVGNATITLPIAFPTAGLFGISGISGANAGGQTFTCMNSAPSTTQMGITTYLNGTITASIGVFWIAIGH